MRFIPSPSRMSLREISAPRSDYPASGENPGRLFVVAKTVGASGERLVTKQVSFFLGRTTLLTFQEGQQDVFEPVRRRIQSPRSHVRANDVSFLLYVLLDYIVDEFFPILDQYAERIERLEHLVLTKPDRPTLPSIHRIKLRFAHDPPCRLAYLRVDSRADPRVPRMSFCEHRALP